MAKIHTMAIVDSKARLGERVEIGPYCVVEGETEIGEGTVLEARAMVRRWTKLGENNVLKPGVILGGEPQHLAYRGEHTELIIGNDNWFGEYVTIHRGTPPDGKTVIGSHNYLMAYSHIGHDCRVGNHVIMTNYAGLAGHCHVEDHALFAAYSGVHQGVRVGTMAMLGAGALVGQDVVPYVIVQGIPGRPRGLNTVGMTRNGVSESVREAVKKAYRILFLERLSLPNAIERIRKEVPPHPEIEHLLEFVQHSARGIARRKES